MKLINTCSRNIYISKSGVVAPGETTPDTNHELATALEHVIDTCGRNFGVILNKKELELLDVLDTLRVKASTFNPESIPEKIRRDPLGLKRATEASRQQQQRITDAVQRSNVKAAEREAIINGEIDEKRTIKPLGVDRGEGGQEAPKSGFEAILAENAKIAAGKPPMNPQEIADPIGLHKAAHQQGVPKYGDDEETGTEGKPMVVDSRSMDKQAEIVAKNLSTFSVFNDKDRQPGAKKEAQPEEQAPVAEPPADAPADEQAGKPKGKKAKASKKAKGK